MSKITCNLKIIAFREFRIMGGGGGGGGGATGATLFSAPQCKIFLLCNDLDRVSMYC